MDTASTDRNLRSRGIYPLLGIMTIVLFPTYMALKFRFPMTRMIMPAVMMIAGLVLIVVSLGSFNRLSKTLDYESVKLWGKTANGKKARSLLLQTGVSGGWLLLYGIVIRMF